MPSRKIDMTDVRVGKLVVIRELLPADKRIGSKWICKCDCGTVVSVQGSSLRAAILDPKKGTRSCGCLRRKSSRDRMRRLWRNAKEEVDKGNRAGALHG